MLPSLPAPFHATLIQRLKMDETNRMTLCGEKSVIGILVKPFVIPILDMGGLDVEHALNNLGVLLSK
jgi:hypothetical protein